MRVALSKMAKQKKGQSSRKRKEEREAIAKAKNWISVRDRKLERAQYLVSLRQAMKNSVRTAVALDASRIGGRKRTNWAVMNLSSGVSGWGPPQVQYWRN